MPQLWSQEQSQETGVGVGPGCEDRGKKGLAGVPTNYGELPFTDKPAQAGFCYYRPKQTVR